MNSIAKILTLLTLLLPFICYGQEIAAPDVYNEVQNRKQIYGFIRGGFYSGFDQDDKDKPYISSSFSDFGLKVEMENDINFKAYADLRFRYGVEFLEPVNSFDVREAYVKVIGKRWDLTVGEVIVKWGRTDFTNPTSKLSPQNLISRSPDRDDMDMGNLLSSFNWYPLDFINLQAVILPFYRSSVLIIDPVPLPENVAINPLNTLITGSEMLSYGLRADIHVPGIDWGISWFDGYDPMPGIALTGFNLDMSGPIPVPLTDLSTTPYKTRVLGFDLETVAGNIGIRGESALSVPYLSYKTNEYVPLPEIEWVVGIDWASGVWRITGEYSGKTFTDFTKSEVDPVIGTEPDYTALAELMAIPGFDLESYVRQQVGAFNRLYNYQVERNYHSIGVRTEADLLYGKITPSLFSMFNITSHDLIIIPEIRYKPSDGLTITAGAEYYSGRSGSLYDIVDGFMNSIFAALRVDF